MKYAEQCTSIHLMDTFTKRIWGLLGRRSANFKEIYLFEHCRSVHSFGMHIPFGVIALDASGTPLQCRNIYPNQLVFFSPQTYAVIELALNNPLFERAHTIIAFNEAFEKANGSRSAFPQEQKPP